MYKNFGENRIRRPSIENDIVTYFNYQFFNGKYLNIATKDTIVFDGKGNILGLENFEIRSYFGTFHPFQDKDVIYFDKRNFYNWVFKGDQLILTRFKEGEEGTDFYELTNEFIRLKRID